MGPLTCKHECYSEISTLVKTNDKYKQLSPIQQKRKIKELQEQCVHPKTMKFWIVLFTCFHTRAIHVEAVTSCNTNDFLDALRHFIGHCGKPSVIYSDNAKYFKAADKCLSTWDINFDQIAAETYKGEAPITWIYSTPEAPWTNGVTERMIGLFKRQLRIALQREMITLRALQTILVELKCIINDRPLGVTDQDCLEVITPNLLVYGRPWNEFVTPSDEKLDCMDYANLWTVRKRVMNHFWDQWRKQYLQELSINNKWKGKDPPAIHVGDVVILKPDTFEKNSWKLARIESVRKNQDGVVVVVSVRRSNGQILERTVRQIALLEPHWHNTEKVDLESPLQSERAGSLGQTLTDPPPGGLLGEVFQPPDRNRPCHKRVREEDEADPGNATIVIAEPVSQVEGDNGMELDATFPSSRNLRKKRQRKGYYRDLAEGKKSQTN